MPMNMRGRGQGSGVRDHDVGRRRWKRRGGRKRRERDRQVRAVGAWEEGTGSDGGGGEGGRGGRGMGSGGGGGKDGFVQKPSTFWTPCSEIPIGRVPGTWRRFIFPGESSQRRQSVCQQHTVSFVTSLGPPVCMQVLSRGLGVAGGGGGGNGTGGG